MQRSRPFARAMALMAALAALGPMSPYERIAAFEKLGGYRSRGKGKGSFSRNYFRGSGSRYTPHQGARECARRRRQMAKEAVYLMHPDSGAAIAEQLGQPITGHQGSMPELHVGSVTGPTVRLP